MTNSPTRGELIDRGEALSVHDRLTEWAKGVPAIRCFPAKSLAYRVMTEGEGAIINSGLHSDGGMSGLVSKQRHIIAKANRVRELHRLIKEMPNNYQLVIAVRYCLRIRHRKECAKCLNWTTDRWRMTCARMEGWLEARL